MSIIDLSTSDTPTALRITRQPSFPATFTLSKPVVDIIAVHGLVESGVQAWTDSETGVLWLKDLFPYQKYNVRVLIHTYKSETFSTPGDGSIDRILPFAQSLIAEIYAERQLNDALERPIVFLCHGFGGLLVKRALVYSSTRRAPKVEHLRSIFVSTYGILFFGTPHDGLQMQGLKILNRPDTPAPNQFVLNLIKGSDMLQEITDQFAPLAKNFAIYNFWEQIKTRTSSGEAFVVNEDSAAPAWHETERCGINVTHERLIKFNDTHESGYKVIAEALIRYCRLAPGIIQDRWENDKSILESERHREAEELLRFRLRKQSEDRVEHTFKDNKYFLVPRRSSSYFTGRKIHAEEVRKKLGIPGSDPNEEAHKVFVIFGLGGAGKTQFCLKYVEENRSRYWGIFWIDASSNENAEAGFASLGQEIGKGATYMAGLHWLSQCHDPWLLVIDNADDPDLDVSQYIPAGNSGHIIVTTRNPSVTAYATAGHLRFSGMDPEEGVNLLLRTASPNSSQIASKVVNPGDLSVAQNIASELGYLAIALAHAGMTIRRNIYSLEKYLYYYLGYRKRMILSTDIKTADEAYIITTWEIPFNRIEENKSVIHNNARMLMNTLAFMHFDSIPEKTLRALHSQHKNGDDASEKRLSRALNSFEEESQTMLRQALRVLYDYSIIDHDVNSGLVSLHPVVQRWARARLSKADQIRWSGVAVGLLASCVSKYMEASGQNFRRSLLPHIDTCLRNMEEIRGSDCLDSVEQAMQFERFAWVFAENGLWKRAQNFQKRVLDYRLKRLGRTHHSTIQARRSLAQTEWNLFEIKPAVITQLKTLVTCWIVRPSVSDWVSWSPWFPDHIPYCVTLSDLTLTLWLAGRREYSKRVGERAVKGLMKRLGSDDPVTLTAMFNLARTYLHLGKHQASRKLLVEVLRKRKRLFGLDHPDTLLARNELGMIYCSQKFRLPVAESLVRGVLETRKKILGEEHAYTLWSMNDLSRVLCARYRSKEAIDILQSIIPVAMRTLGEKHVGISMTKSNLAFAFVLDKRWVDAEALLREFLPNVPEEHPDWVHVMSGYIYVRTALDQLTEAEGDCLRVLNAVERRKFFPKNNPRVLAIAGQLALIYQRQARSEDLAALTKRFPGTHVSDQQTFNFWEL